MSLYVGQNGTPKKVSKLLVGVNGTTKEVSTGYTGNASSAKQVVYSGYNIDKELAKTDPVDAIQSGKVTKADVGKTVYLSNSAITCQEWQIADVNHDNNKNTVDLVSKYVIGTSNAYDYTWGGSSLYGQYEQNESNPYDYNYINRYLHNYVSGFSAKVRHNLAIFDYDIIGDISGGSVNFTYSKGYITAPSSTELGFMPYTNSSHFDWSTHGSIYPLFGTTLVSFGSANTYAIRKVINSSNSSYWTRSYGGGGTMADSYTTDAYAVTASGVLSRVANYNNGGTNKIIGVIRFKTWPSQEIHNALSKSNPVDILTSGRITEDYIGHTVTLSNSDSDVVCDQWVICGVNHNGTSGTVDLISCEPIFKNAMYFGNTYGGLQQGYYKDSFIRSTHLPKVLNGFTTDVKNSLVNMKVLYSSGGGNVASMEEKIKLPSIEELGGSGKYDPYIDSSCNYPYKLFAPRYTDSTDIKYLKTGKQAMSFLTSSVYGYTAVGGYSYWVRDSTTNPTINGTMVNSEGHLKMQSVISSSDIAYVRPVIRFGKK